MTGALILPTSLGGVDPSHEERICFLRIRITVWLVTAQGENATASHTEISFLMFSWSVASDPFL